MTSFTIFSNSVTPQTLTANDIGLITTAGVLTGLTSTTVTATNTSAEITKMAVMGSLIYAGNGAGHALDFNGDSFSLFVADGAQVISLGSGSATLDFFASGHVNISNNGSIYGKARAIVSNTDGFSSSFNLTNTGQISAGTYAIGLFDQKGFVSIINDGSIISNAYAISNSDGLAFAHTTSLWNTGVITGRLFSYRGSDGSDKVFNSGQMSGSIEMRAGNDSYFGSVGNVEGEVYGGDGDDRLIGGSGDNIFYGGNDNDMLRGNGGADLLDGGNGDDVLKGGDGNDVLDGGAGNDILRGHTDDDELNGGSGSDHIYGGQGNDDLDGGGGADVLKGGIDDDKLAGKTGIDTMTGGRGDDVFVFANASHSGTGAAADTITDFGLGRDVIDLAGLSGGTLDFIGTSGFSNTAGEVRYNVTASGTAKVSIDLDGDGEADMQIKLLETSSLNESDFIL